MNAVDLARLIKAVEHYDELIWTVEALLKLVREKGVAVTESTVVQSYRVLTKAKEGGYAKHY